MNTWDISASLVHLVLLAGATAAVLLLRHWLGGRGRTYLALVAGLILLGAAEGVNLLRLSQRAELASTMIAWDSLTIHGGGYIIICLGIALWIRDLRTAQRRLERDNFYLQQSAATDYLTQLLNRRHAAVHLKREMARARRNGTPVGFIMVDLDHFKAVNDTHGHQAGDTVLAHIANLLKTRVRESDMVIRYGGEEFLIVVPETDLPGTVQLADSLRLLIQQSPATHAGQRIPVSASLGVAVAEPRANLTSEQIVERADSALYAAKTRGRNRVMSWAELANAPAETAPTPPTEPARAAP
jgi:diguanylate cyclase (GGDEF)-like protein